ncbi:hypothetical protein BGZ74_000189, partial [Mortierella antarctica]
MTGILLTRALYIRHYIIITRSLSLSSAPAHAFQNADAAAANTQNIARAINNFEDVFGEGSRYNNNDSENSDTDTDGNTDGDTDGDEDHDSTLQNTPRPSTSATRHSTHKRKSVAVDPEDKDASQVAKHKGKQVKRDGDSQTLLEQSHLRSDALRVNEFAIDLALHTQRHSSLSKSTIASYDHYQHLWVEWCNRKGYPDFLVTKSKFQVYMSENLAEDTDEEKDIHPIHIKRKKMEEARNSDGFNKNDYLPSVELVEVHVKALCDL